MRSGGAPSNWELHRGQDDAHSYHIGAHSCGDAGTH